MPSTEEKDAVGLVIQLNKNDNYAGDVVTGKVCLDVYNEITCTSLDIRIMVITLRVYCFVLIIHIILFLGMRIVQCELGETYSSR